MASLVDQVYRSFVISKFFSRGWGNPDQLKRLFEFRKQFSNRDEAIKLVDPDHPILIDKVQLDDSGECKLIDGHFRSPFADHCPGLLPPVAENAYFQLVVPADGWKGQKDRPLCIHMAGTGDHYFWRRRNLLAKPLLKDHGVSSLILENPFYGARKPQEQYRSSLLNVSDIFVMGGALILESIAILNWCEKEGFWPTVMHGISMGGHMASLAAATWHKPVGVVPCLSWSTASGVFTQGVMSTAIDWKSLETQFLSNNFLKDELYQMVLTNHDEAYIAGKEFVSQYKDNCPVQNEPKVSSIGVQGKNVFQALTNFLKERGLLKILPDLNTMNSSKPQEEIRSESAQTELKLKQKEFKTDKIIDFKNIMGSSKSKVQKEAIQFMRGVMDEFTHLKNFSKPVDPEIVIVIAARDDAYIPREGYEPMQQIWPGCDVRFVDCGHISAYVLHQKLFKQTIAEAVAKFRAKYHPDGRIKEKLADSSQKVETETKEMLDVLGFQKAKTTNDSSHRV